MNDWTILFCTRIARGPAPMTTPPTTMFSSTTTRGIILTPQLDCVRLVITDGRLPEPGSTALLAEEMPTVRIEIALRNGATDVVVDAERWIESDKELIALDRELDAFLPREAEEVGTNWIALSVRGHAQALERVAIEVLTRSQRFVDRRNMCSSLKIWDVVRRAHAALHDFSKPLVVADFNHAVDTWQWILRLKPNAGLAVQLAALFHDIERLESEPDRRIEQFAPDYQAFKQRHAKRGAEWAFEVLRSVNVTEGVAKRVRELITEHEMRSGEVGSGGGATKRKSRRPPRNDADVDLLNDADALSFFSLNSAGYADYFGPEQTRKKVLYTLGRMGRSALDRVLRPSGGIRLRSDVRAHVRAALRKDTATEETPSV